MSVTLRRALDTDVPSIVDVWTRSFAEAMPTVRRAHDDAEVATWFADVVLPRHEAWVAASGDAIVGIMVLEGEELSQLYLDPSWRGRGIGDQFIRLAKRRSPSRLELWTFQINTAAQRFYERHGFIAVERTDGANNEEHEPDVRYRWHADMAASVAGARG